MPQLPWSSHRLPRMLIQMLGLKLHQLQVHHVRSGLYRSSPLQWTVKEGRQDKTYSSLQNVLAAKHLDCHQKDSHGTQVVEVRRMHPRLQSPSMIVWPAFAGCFNRKTP